MAKLFPPVIEGIIPAFYSENGIVKITIPFSMNKAVSKKQVSDALRRKVCLRSFAALF